AVDKGTTVHVLFPLVEEAASPTYPENDEPLPSGTERIMFVDDEERIADFGKKFLGRLGYKVSDFTNAVEALEAFKRSKDNYDLVVTDKTMPKLNGFDLAREIRKVRPDIPVMLCTGYSEKSDEAKAREAGIQEFVIKPLDQRQMARTIRKILDDKP
ncbi:MAG: response regulator, partial [bacterium]|nr:response regulator [bacterium]